MKNYVLMLNHPLKGDNGQMINSKEFAKRRRQLLRMMGRDSIAILPTSPVRMRNRDVEYRYRPDSDFYYLTGFPEPGAVAVLLPRRCHGEFILFCRQRDPHMESWHGRRAGQAGAIRDYGADDSFPIDDIDDILPGLLENKERVFYTMGRHPGYDQRVMAWVNRLRDKSRAGVHTPGEFVSLDHFLHDMRLYKSASEIKVMKEAAKISAEAHSRAMSVCRPGMMEYEIEAELIRTYHQNGSQAPAYTPIVGSGANSCILHYNENNRLMESGDVLLIDAAAEVDYYASDITRTFPVNGKFSKAQRSIYELVLEAQLAAIEEVKPGNHWNDPHKAAVKVVTSGLVKLGLLSGRLSTLIKNEAHTQFYMHRTGHWLGMDVHDVGDYKVGDEWRLLEPGMVMTVEPGIYIAAGSKGVSRKWRNIGIRIEDDVVVTRSGNQVISKAAPRQIQDIEAIVGSADI
ncbi:MAG: Xaa-Pro aminopeptidase [Gammaproteobacteria bacterium]|nr:MAG: Xaa-Pro aminopeptidase [Gammaproteobacteria bacterium]